jgi:CMP-N-acetylneuraminic acid synthetase
MKNKQTFLAIIPARQGSKRLPNKNILPLAGKPLIGWTIEAALNSTYLDEVMVSTDSEAIAKIALVGGAKVPFLRPAELSDDTASSFAVVEHAINYYKTQKKHFDNIVLLQPTSPLRTSKNIDEAIELFISKNANSVTSVCEMEHSPLWSNTLPENLSMKGFIRAEIQGNRSQDLETYYRLNGAIYIIKTSSFLNEKSFISTENCFAYIMKTMHSIDIDEEMDFSYANYLVEKLLIK